jgi:tRNA dimethylallyltransferase
MQNIIIVTGPTAVGKTAITITLAKQLNTEIISCDSMQLYQHMTIGSAKPTEQERAEVVHHLIDCINPFDSYSVSSYANDAKSIINKLHHQGKCPLITGGTGLYINSLMYDMDFSHAPKDDSIRELLARRLEVEGLDALYKELSTLAPTISAKIHPNNKHKIIRALEITLKGSQLGDFSTDLVQTKDYGVKLVVLTRDRQELYNRINKRVDLMLEEGLVNEVSTLLNMGLTKEHQSMKGIGYKEVIAYLENQVSYEEMVETLKQNSRRYAKRQLTWLRRYNNAKWINLSEITNPNDQINAIIDVLE